MGKSGVALSLSLLFAVVPSRAQNEIAVSAEEVQRRFGPAPVLGLIFICDPYCRFLAVNEGKGWKPGLGEEKVPAASLKLVRPSDPEYPLLIQDSPILPFIEKQKETEGATIDPRLAAFEKKRLEEQESWLMSYDFGLQAVQVDTSSDTNLLSDSRSKAPLTGLKLALEIRPISVYSFWKMDWRPSFEAEMKLTEAGPTPDPTQKISLSEQSLALRFRNLRPAWSPVVLMEYEMAKMGSSLVTTSHYAVSRDSLFLGGGVAGKSWLLEAATGFFSSVKEDAGYRTKPFQRSVYRFEAQYCRPRLRSFGFGYTLCGELGYENAAEKSGINEALITGLDGSSIQIQMLRLGISVRYGDSLWE